VSSPEERQWNLLFQRLDRIEDRQEKRLTRDEFKEFEDDVEEQIERIQRDVLELRRTSITPDQITNMIGQSLQSSQARGLTQRDRYVRYGLALVSILSFAILVLQQFRGG